MNGFENLGYTPAEFVNGVREALPERYKQSLPIAEEGQTSFTGIGEVLAADEQFANVWHKAALNLVAQILVHDNKITNPLAEFEGDLITTGDKLEEMIIDTAETFAFNPSKAERNLFKRRAPELKTAIHTAKRDVSAVRTLQDTVITDIFHDASELDRYVINVTQAMLSGNEYEKYYTTKELISRQVYKGRVRTIDLGKSVTPSDLQTQIMTHSKLMLHPNRFYNMGNVGQPDAHGNTGINIQADFAQLRMLLPVSTSVGLDINFFANVFQKDAVQSGLAIKEVDYFPSIYEYTADHTVTVEDIANGFVDENMEVGEVIKAGAQASEEAYNAAAEGAKDIELKFDGSRIQAVILDRRALLINPMLPMTFASIANPLGRYTNIILQDKSFYSFSAFMPAAVILADKIVKPVELAAVTIDGQSAVDANGVANIPYSAETGKSSSEVFDDPSVA